MLAEVFMSKTQALGRASKDWSTTQFVLGKDETAH